MIEQYLCPKDNTVLYEKDLGVIHLAQIGDEPKECPKCKKSWFKYECKTRTR